MGRDAYDTYLNERISQSIGPKTTEKEFIDKYGEDKIAIVMSRTGKSRQEVIDEGRREMDARKAQ